MARTNRTLGLALALGIFAGPAIARPAIPREPSVTANSSGAVHVTLGDPSSAAAPADMELMAEPNAIAGGRVTFLVANTSRTLEHELLVVRLHGKRTALPYDEVREKVIERSIDKIGDSGDLEPGTSTTFTLPLVPGRYLLMCNEPGHYRAGMWQWLTVSRGGATPASLERFQPN